MPDEPSNAELARQITALRQDQSAQITALRQDQRDDFTEIKVQLTQMVRREVYDAQRAADVAEIKTLREQVAAMQSRTRWFIAGVVVPTLMVILGWLLQAKGVKS